MRHRSIAAITAVACTVALAGCNADGTVHVAASTSTSPPGYLADLSVACPLNIDPIEVPLSRADIDSAFHAALLISHTTTKTAALVEANRTDQDTARGTDVVKGCGKAIAEQTVVVYTHPLPEVSKTESIFYVSHLDNSWFVWGETTGKS